MVTSVLEAQEIARRWVADHAPAREGEVGLYEFDLGYVAWAVPPPSPERSGPPAFVGAPRLVIDKDTGEVSVWPSLSVPAVAERYRQQRRAEQRFPDGVRGVLTRAGWHPDRDMSSSVNLWLAQLYEQDPSARRVLPLFGLARAALAEFGGLRITPLTPADNASGGLRIELWPTDRPLMVGRYAALAATIDTLVFPLAWYDSGASHAVVDETGRVYLLHPGGVLPFADSVDEAITLLVRGPDLIGSVSARSLR